MNRDGNEIGPEGPDNFVTTLVVPAPLWLVEVGIQVMQCSVP